MLLSHGLESRKRQFVLRYPGTEFTSHPKPGLRYQRSDSRNPYASSAIIRNTLTRQLTQ